MNSNESVFKQITLFSFEIVQNDHIFIPNCPDDLIQFFSRNASQLYNPSDVIEHIFFDWHFDPNIISSMDMLTLCCTLWPDDYIFHSLDTLKSEEREKKIVLH